MSDSRNGSGDVCYLSDISLKDKPWDVHRALADCVVDLYRGSLLDPLAGRIAACSGFLEFGWLPDPETGECRLRLKSAHFCRCRHCPVCQWRRSLMWLARFFRACPKILEDYPTARYLMLTLTVRNCDVGQLRETLTWMSRSWQRLTQRRQWPGIGFVRATEVTRAWDWYFHSTYVGRHGVTWYTDCWLKEHPKKKLRMERTDEVHPHFHVLLMVKTSYFNGGYYLSQQKWTDLWQSCLQVDYKPIVHIQAVKSRSGGMTDEDYIHSLRKDVLEVFKYSVKPADLVGKNSVEDREWLIQLTDQLYKTRSIALGGTFKNYLSESDPEDLIGEDVEDEEEVVGSVYFEWMKFWQRYVELSSLHT